MGGGEGCHYISLVWVKSEGSALGLGFSVNIVLIFPAKEDTSPAGTSWSHANIPLHGQEGKDQES